MTRDDFIRTRPRERHERYELDGRSKRPGFDYYWAATKVMGQPNPRFTDALRAGWRPARAADHPQQSGIDLTHDPRLQELGYLSTVNPDDPVVDGDLMLMLRPQEMSEASRGEDEKAADRQISDHLGRLQQTSRRAIGDRTQISRRTTRGAAPADMVPDEAELEE